LLCEALRVLQFGQQILQKAVSIKFHTDMFIQVRLWEKSTNGGGVSSLPPSQSPMVYSSSVFHLYTVFTQSHQLSIVPQDWLVLVCSWIWRV